MNQLIGFFLNIGNFSLTFKYFSSFYFLFCRRAIRTAFKNKKRAAILTTHYMEEAEAVCDRVAIMIAGQLRYISDSHLEDTGWVLNVIM